MIRSLREVPGFVSDAFVHVSIPYQPENLVLGNFTLLPWVRDGISAVAGPAADGRVRARVAVRLAVQAGTESIDVPQTLDLYGPGDVLGLDASQIVRRHPAPNAEVAEANLLAHVEFDRPELPWLFSPFAVASDRLAPWLALVVVRASTVSVRSGREGRPPVVTTVLGELQSLDDSWAWAHAQLIGRPEDGAIGDRLGTAHGPANLSRILCPRRLDGEEDWVACLVPATDVGRRAALGFTGGGLGPAWTRVADESDKAVPIELPVFDRWAFHTGPAGDFESLAERLVPIAAPYAVGRRVIDMSRPLGARDALEPADVGRRQVIRGPLVSPLTDRPPDVPPDDVTWANEKTTWLVERLDAADKQAHKPGGLPQDQRPILGPEIYGRYHAARQRVEGELQHPDDSWFGQLNLRPVNRVVAGLGTRVVQMDQEPLMQSAWAQIGQIEEANQWIRFAQLGRFVAEPMHRSLARLPDGDLLHISRRVQSRIGLPDGLTVAGAIDRSATPGIAVSGAFRRATRTRGPLARFATTAERRGQIAALVVRRDGPRDFARPYRDLDGVTRLTEAAIRAVDPVLIAQTFELGPVDADTAFQHLMQQAPKLAGPAAPDRLTAAAIEAMTLEPSFNLAEIATRRVLAALPSDLDVSSGVAPAVAVSHLGLLQGLKGVTTAATPEVATSIAALSTSLSSVAGLSAATAAATQAVAARQAELEAATANRIAVETGASSGLAVELARTAEARAGAAVRVATQAVAEDQVVMVSAAAFVEAVNSMPATEVITTFAGNPFLGRFAGSPVFAGSTPVVVAPEHDVPAHLTTIMTTVAPTMVVPSSTVAGSVTLHLGGLAGPVHFGGPDLTVLGGLAGPGALGGVGPLIAGGLVAHPIDVDAAIGPVLLGGADGPHVVVVNPAGGAADGSGAAAEPAVVPVVALSPAAARLSAVMASAAAVTPIAVKAGLATVIGGLVQTSWPKTPVRPPLRVVTADLLGALEPRLTVTARIEGRFSTRPAWLPSDWFHDGLLQPIMAAPTFTRAMYEALDAYEREWLIPGLGDIPATDIVTALVTNATFIEAFLIGLSHEMGRELLWRGYPTDQRGTYFRRFFDPATDELSVDGEPGFIHRFTPTQLRTHLLATLDGRLVFLIRGELIRRYPDVVVSMVRQASTDNQGKPVFSDTPARPLFLAAMTPNITLAGFDLTKEQVLAASDPGDGHPWWLIIAEHPTAPRFGLDLADGPPAATPTRAELAWGELPERVGALDGAAGTTVLDGTTAMQWGIDAATNAHLLLQDPIRAAFRADELLQTMDEGPG